MHPSQPRATSPNQMLGQPHEDAQYGERPSTRGSVEPPEHSAHSRSRSTAFAPTPRRLSVFSGRSRSNTTTSTTPYALGVPPQDERMAPPTGMRSERPESTTKSFFSRGSRILRRQGSKLSISATLDEEDEPERDRSVSDLPEFFGRRHKSRQGSSCK